MSRMIALALFLCCVAFSPASARRHRHELLLKRHRRHRRGSLKLKAALQGNEPVPPAWPANSSTPLHISLSAFQDGFRCARTITWALTKAAHPERLSFGVVQARSKKDVDCVAQFKKHHLDSVCDTLKENPAFSQNCPTAVLGRIRKKILPMIQAEGPSHQRSFAVDLIDFARPDSFCMQTDAHMDFIPGFDEDLISDWKLTNNEFAVLTGYPMSIGDADVASSTRVDCCGWFIEPGSEIPRGMTCGNLPRSEKLYLTMNWAAGFSFHRCHAERNAPIDPELEYLFTGEEIDRAARLWTHGYDMYLPTHSVVLHNYTAAKQSFWQAAPPEEIETKKEVSSNLLRRRLSSRNTKKEWYKGRDYGLGSQRTWDQFEQWMKPTTDLHPEVEDWSQTNGQKYCSEVNLPWVPVANRKALEDSARKPAA